ncbi:MAG: DUF952 domain-containing protein [Parachlamydiaceae bacterium]|nr:DUF952 domain-containing protein [Parachlamydiaceae bacterium]
MVSESHETPKFLYKVLSEKHWTDSQQNKVVMLSDMDDDFIHLSKEDQLDRIIHKYWANVPKIIVLKLDTTKLQGEMVYEANPGGLSKYYHLYKGVIPLSSVAEVKVIER